jgi:hypothetical protein
MNDDGGMVLDEFHVTGDEGTATTPGRVRLNIAVKKNPLGTLFDTEC